MIRPIAIAMTLAGLLTVGLHAKAQGQRPQAPPGQAAGARAPAIRPTDPTRTLEAQREQGAQVKRMAEGTQGPSEQARPPRPPKEKPPEASTDGKKEEPRKHREKHEHREAKAEAEDKK